MAWLDEERIQLRISIWERNNSGESPDDAVNLGNEYFAALNVLSRKRNHFRMSQESLSIARIVEGSSPLKRLKRFVVSGNRCSYGVDRVH